MEKFTSINQLPSQRLQKLLKPDRCSERPISRQTAGYPPYKDDRPPKGVTIRETYMTWSASLPPFLCPRRLVLWLQEFAAAFRTTATQAVVRSPDDTNSTVPLHPRQDNPLRNPRWTNNTEYLLVSELQVSGVQAERLAQPLR